MILKGSESKFYFNKLLELIVIFNFIFMIWFGLLDVIVDVIFFYLKGLSVRI